MSETGFTTEITAGHAGGAGLGCAIEFAGERLDLLPERAVWWPAQRTLLVADTHLGKPASFRAVGAPVPEQVTRTDLEKLTELVKRHDVSRLIVLGDLAHDDAAWRDVTLHSVVEWRDRHAGVELVLIRGNHDRWAKDPPRELHIEVVEPGWITGGISMHHEPPEGSEAGPSLCGHIHPGVALRGRRSAGGMRAACFWFSDQLGVLPAFGSFTGCATVRPKAHDRVFALGDGSIMEIKPAGTNGVSQSTAEENPAHRRPASS